MAINLFTLDYSDAQTIKTLQVQAIQTVRKSSSSEKANNKTKHNKKINKIEQDDCGKELKIIFEKLDLNFEYIIEKYKISIKVFDKDNKLVLEDSLSDLRTLLISIKNDKGKIIDLKI